MGLDYPIIITSNEPWGDVWYSKQNYAFELSKRTTVYFINPPTKWKLRNLISSAISMRNYSSSLFIVDYENPLPVLNKFFNKLNNFWISIRLLRFLRKCGVTNYIFWSFDPLRLYVPQLLKPKFSIFHCVDYFYFKYPGEKILCEKSDVIFSTSAQFLKDYNDFITPKYIVPHGISEDEFMVDTEEVALHKIGLSNIGLYVGVVDHRLDYELLAEAIATFSDINFVFIGPVKLPNLKQARRIFKEDCFPNVTQLGPRHFKVLKNYIYQSSFCISFMDPNFHMNTVHHHKTLIYLAQGKPVFGYEYYEYKKLGDLMYMDKKSAGIINKLARFIEYGETSSLTIERINYAKTYTFDKVLDQAFNHIPIV